MAFVRLIVRKKGFPRQHPETTSLNNASNHEKSKNIHFTLLYTGC